MSSCLKPKTKQKNTREKTFHTRGHACATFNTRKMSLNTTSVGVTNSSSSQEPFYEPLAKASILGRVRRQGRWNGMLTGAAIDRAELNLSFRRQPMHAPAHIGEVSVGQCRGIEFVKPPQRCAPAHDRTSNASFFRVSSY